jgi:ATP-dependent Clp protease ATP-binding subunit ClpA
MRQRVLDELRGVFRPEFLNRLDDVVVFHRLDKGHILRIVELQLQDFARRLEAQRMGLEVSRAAREALADEGYDPAYGARPLKRAIARHLETPISKAIVAGELQEGGKVRVDLRNGEFVCTPA